MIHGEAKPSLSLQPELNKKVLARVQFGCRIENRKRAVHQGTVRAERKLCAEMCRAGAFFTTQA